MENSLNLIGKDIVFNDNGDFKIDLKGVDHAFFKVEKNKLVSLYLENISKTSLIFNIEENANLKLTFIIKEENNDVKLEAKVKKEAGFNIVFGDFCHSNTNLNSKIDLVEENANSSIIFSSISYERYKKKYVLNYNHFNKTTESNLKGFGVSLNESEISVKGDSYIPKESIKSKASQDVKIILFDKESRGIASPILKIECDDIKANHACSIGSINNDHLYYLMSRGIDIETVRKLIVLGYITPIEQHFNEDVKNEIEDIIGSTF